MSAETAHTRSVFLDVVGFTKGRTVEDQTAIVGRLNDVVRGALEAHDVSMDSVVVLPTGDGLCLCLIDLLKPFDLPMLIATTILTNLRSANDAEPRAQRRFQVRIGLNENIDNIVVDFNERRNVAGAGISFAQRVMDKADGGQILVSEPTFKTLSPREKYFDKFRRYFGTTKHGESFSVYQYVEASVSGLNTEPPSVFLEKPSAPPRALSDESSRYLALAWHLRARIKKCHLEDSTADWYLTPALALLAHDESALAKAPEFEAPTTKCRVAGGFEEFAAHYRKNDSWISLLATERVASDLLRGLSACFEKDSVGFPMYSIISETGVTRLEKECPELMENLKSGKWKPLVCP